VRINYFYKGSLSIIQFYGILIDDPLNYAPEDNLQKIHEVTAFS